MITGIIDESVTEVDKLLSRVSICIIEIDDSSVIKELGSIKEQVEKDKIRFPDLKGKYHFSEFNVAQRHLLIEKFAKLPFNAKIYTYYLTGNKKQAKIDAMKAATDHFLWLHRTKNVQLNIEYSEEYKSTKFEKLLTKDHSITILPDAILHIFKLHLSEVSNTITSDNVQFYNLIRQKIRLQVFKLSNAELYLTREKKI